MQLPTTFSEKLILTRARAGLSQAQLARASGIRQGQISRYERGERLPSVEEVVLMERAFGLASLAAGTDWCAEGHSLHLESIGIRRQMSISPPGLVLTMWPFEKRLESAMKSNPYLCRGLIEKIQARPNAAQLFHFLRNVWTDSVPEAFYWLRLATGCQ